MKRFIIYIFCFFLTHASYSQKHVSFMNIPLYCTISQFQTKLAEKKILPNKDLNKILPVGIRAFSGIFSNENAEIYVYYNGKSKYVYRAKAVVSCINKNDVEAKQKSYKNRIGEKYLNSTCEEVEKDGHPAYIFMLVDENDFESFIGTIGLYISKDEYDGGYSLHIDYQDVIGTEFNKIVNMDDL